MFKNILQTSTNKLYGFCFCFLAAPLRGTALLSSQSLQRRDFCRQSKNEKKSKCSIADNVNVLFINYTKVSYIGEVMF